MTDQFGEKIVSRPSTFKLLKEVSRPSYIDEKSIEGKVLFGIEKSDKIRVMNPLLLVPRNIEVYQMVGNYGDKGLLFFARREAHHSGYAFLVVPTIRGFTGETYSNVCPLLSYPWFDVNASCTIWENIVNKRKTKVAQRGLARKNTPHPLAQN